VLAFRKLALAVVVVAALGWLFLKTIRDTNAEPYTVDAAELSGWTLALEDPQQGGPALLVLNPPAQLVGEVFRQIFLRTGQSLAGPVRAAVPVVLHAEYAGALKGLLSPEELLQAAREARLERERFEPLCLGMKREATGAREIQRFFLVLESAAFSGFRSELSRRHEAGGGSGRFDATSLPPILPVASFEPDFHRWPWPPRVDAATDCTASVVVSP
jgi:hypothetical protein